MLVNLYFFFPTTVCRICAAFWKILCTICKVHTQNLQFLAPNPSMPSFTPRVFYNQVYIQRTEGCDHMTCSRCDTEFCYRCGERRHRLKLFGFVLEDHDMKHSIIGCNEKFKPDQPVQRALTRGGIFGEHTLPRFILPTTVFVVRIVSLEFSQKREIYFLRMMFVVVVAQSKLESVFIQINLVFHDIVSIWFLGDVCAGWPNKKWLPNNSW